MEIHRKASHVEEECTETENRAHIIETMPFSFIQIEAIGIREAIEGVIQKGAESCKDANIVLQTEPLLLHDPECGEDEEVGYTSEKKLQDLLFKGLRS